MRILIHALGATMGGGARHLSGFLPAISALTGGHTFRVILRESSPYRAQAGIQVQMVPDRRATFGPARVWFDNIEIQTIIREFRADVLISLTNIGPICVSIPHFIFQRNALLFTSLPKEQFSTRQRLKFFAQRQLAVSAMRRAKRIITPSFSMADMVQKACPAIPQEKFCVLPHALDLSTYGAALSQSVSRQIVKDTIKIIYPALAAPHKGLTTIFQIANVLPRSLGATIYVTGGDEGGKLINEARSRARDSGLDDRLVFTGCIPQPEMGALYRVCDLLLYVSEVESFGFPLLEGLAFGLPIVAVDTAVNREICGKAALYFSPGCIHSAASLIRDALDYETRRRMREAAAARFAAYDRTWLSYATSLLTIVDRSTTRSLAHVD